MWIPTQLSQQWTHLKLNYSAPLQCPSSNTNDYLDSLDEVWAHLNDQVWVPGENETRYRGPSSLWRHNVTRFGWKTPTKFDFPWNLEGMPLCCEPIEKLSGLQTLLCLLFRSMYRRVQRIRDGSGSNIRYRSSPIFPLFVSWPIEDHIFGLEEQSMCKTFVWKVNVLTCDDKRYLMLQKRFFLSHFASIFCNPPRISCFFGDARIQTHNQGPCLVCELSAFIPGPEDNLLIQTLFICYTKKKRYLLLKRFGDNPTKNI